MSEKSRADFQGDFFEDEAEFEDLDAAIMEAGGYQLVGSQLFPDNTALKASQRLRDCLNPKKRDKLSWPQIKFIFSLARERGGAVGINHMLAECGYLETRAQSDAEIAQQVALDVQRLHDEHEQRIAQLLKRAGLLQKGKR